MKRDLGFDSGSGDPANLDSNGSGGMGRCYVPKARQAEAGKGFYVYTRNKRLRTRSAGKIGCLYNLQGESGVLVKASLNGEPIVGAGGAVNVGGFESDGEMMDIEVQEDPYMAARYNVPRRFTRSLLKSEEMTNDESRNLRDAVILEAGALSSKNSAMLASPKARKMEMKMSKKILISTPPTTVRELFETGLLEGYPVFYNGGKKGFPLRGMIKDGGILCFCSSCKGVQVVPPCQFEIHACHYYRRASQYICLENGKSLLDVVKECQGSSVKTLEQTIHGFLGPLPVKEIVTCRNCKGPFLATHTMKVETLCDSCLVLNPQSGAECVKSRSLEPPLGIEMAENEELLKTPIKKGRRGRKKGKHSQLTPNTKFPGRSMPGRKKGQSKIIKIMSKSASIRRSPRSTTVRHSAPTSNDSTSIHDSLKSKTTRTILKKLSNSTTLSKTLKNQSPLSVQSKSSLKITKKDQRMHKLVFENGGLPDGTEVAYYSNGKKLCDGYKKGSGIICSCCNSLVSPSQFEAHAGWASRRKPYMYIYTSNGVSLHEFAISLLKGRDFPSIENDDLCIICADGGKLVLCDGCPRAFHKECASLSSVPRGKWYCTYCQNMFERERFVEWNANAIAAGRVAGIDPIEQITNRCIRIVKNPEEAEVIACVICRGKDFSKSGFGPRTVILCDQCEKEYHVGCLKKCKMADLKELPKGKWFCCASCKGIHSELQGLLNAGEEKLSDFSMGIITEKQTEEASLAETDIDIRWRLLNGKKTTRETRLLLSQAVAIFHDSFAPIIDPTTGRDFIPSLVYGRNIRGQDFGGMYCAILSVNSTVVSVAIFRIFGQEVAELPLVATRKGCQGKGYFQALYTCIEQLLARLKVKNIILPATDEAKSIWTEKFKFEKIPEDRLLNHKKSYWQMITFTGTSMLEKAVPKYGIMDKKR